MLKNILGTAALGIIILIASIFALFINEHNYVNAIKIVNFAEKNTIIADANNFNHKMKINSFTLPEKLIQIKL